MKIVRALLVYLVCLLGALAFGIVAIIVIDWIFDLILSDARGWLSALVLSAICFVLLRQAVGRKPLIR